MAFAVASSPLALATTTGLPAAAPFVFRLASRSASRAPTPTVAVDLRKVRRLKVLCIGVCRACTANEAAEEENFYESRELLLETARILTARVELDNTSARLR